MSGNPLVRFDEGRVGRTQRCRLLSYSTGSIPKHSFCSIVTVSDFRMTFVTTLTQLLDVLAACHGEQTVAWPTDPYLFLVWLHCGYPASEAKCAKGWESLSSQIGVDAERILKATQGQPCTARKRIETGGNCTRTQSDASEGLRSAFSSSTAAIYVRD